MQIYIYVSRSRLTSLSVNYDYVDKKNTHRIIKNYLGL